MTLEQALVTFDNYRKNTIPTDTKLSWINSIEAIIFNEIISTHSNPENKTYSPLSLPDNAHTELLVPHPYTDVYTHYLALQSDLTFGDVPRYNNDLSLYTSSFYNLAKHVNKNLLPTKTTHCFNA